MDDKELAKRLTEVIGGSRLWRLRRKTAYTTGRNFQAAGELLHGAADPKDEAYKQMVAVSMLLRMAGELTAASARLLSTGQYYVGAALLRQIVEIEYLPWTFKEKYRDPEQWLDSTFDGTAFSPFLDHTRYWREWGIPCLGCFRRGLHRLQSPRCFEPSAALNHIWEFRQP